MDGEDQERTLVKKSNEEGYPAIRLAASGAGTTMPLPDVFLRAGNYYVAGELKSSSADYAYIEEEEQNDLRAFCEAWSGDDGNGLNVIPVAISRWSYDSDFYVQPLTTADDGMFTKSGNLALRRNNRGRYYEFFRYCAILERS